MTKPETIAHFEATDNIDYHLASITVGLSWAEQALPQDTPVHKAVKEATYNLKRLEAKLGKETRSMTTPQDPLRKPLLDWYHNAGSQLFDIDFFTLRKAIEEVYGVDVVKREVPKE